MRIRLLVLELLLPLALAAQGHSGKPPKPTRVVAPVTDCSVVGRVVLDQHVGSTVVGGTVPVTGKVYSSCNVLLPATGVGAATIAWVSRTPAVATVASAAPVRGTITGVAGGTTRIVGSVGGKSDSLTLTVTGALPPPPPVDTLPCVASATTIVPGDSIQAKVNAQGTGVAFTVCDGVYRMQKFTPKTGQSFTGRPGATLDGARILSGFTASGSNYYIGGQTQQGAQGGLNLGCQPSYPMCHHPEQLWRDGVVQTPVAALGDLAAGKWFFDYGADRIYVRDDPSGYTIETSVTPVAITGTANNVTIASLLIQHFAAPFGSGAIDGSSGNGWIVRDVTGRQNGGVAVRIEGDNWRIVKSRLSGNGQFGLSGSKIAGFILDSTQVDSNCTAGWNVGAACGAMKITQSDSTKIRWNWIRRNAGNGIWIDIDNRWTTIYANTVDSNDYQGAFVEISYGAHISYNTVRGNGFGRANATCFGAGILVAASPGVEIDHNIVQHNHNGICAVQQARGSGAYGPHEINNLNVHDNTSITDAGTYSGLSVGTGDASYFVSRGNSFSSNSYTNADALPYIWQFSRRTAAEWAAYGQD